jgi:hypothetical protein
MKKAMLCIAALVSALSLKSQTSSYSIPDGEYLTIGNYSSSNEPKGILFTGFRDVLPNYFGASIEAVNVWTCCGTYPGSGYAGIKHIGLNFNIHDPNNAGSADAKITAMSIAASGNVGIGTTDPKARLEVFSANGDISTGVFHSSGGQSWGHVLTLATDATVGNDDARLLFSYRNKSKQWALGGSNSTTRFGIWEDCGDGVYGNSFGTERLTILAGGSVGIGTTAPDQKLTVNGKIHAEEVIVDLNVPLADYVFARDYELMPLHRVEEYVQENSRLPEMPSATEVKEKGMGMGEMQNKMLQKIEELTLYMIQQDKRIKALEEENQRLKK